MIVPKKLVKMNFMKKLCNQAAKLRMEKENV